MKNFKKLLSIAIAAIMSLSAMSLNVFAKETITFDNGVEINFYSDDEAPVRKVRTADFTFSQSFAKYPSKTVLNTPYTVNSVNNVIELGNGESEICFEFNSSPNQCYLWVYNVNTGTYLINGYYMGNNVDENYSISNLPSGNVYRIMMAGTSSIRLSGSCYTM